ncbi:ESX secretion-associated protein EspG [Actinokineospora spheciospongiae]|uniref:ESX secretion-associated protein EspG n=1 Tax=Actinokineospora spheciospongiae TaxID=909613 RepID=UPI00190F6928|nr:ESX secretion-associated protein EspG [Actinokineospora spheciospongiae]
MTAPTPLFVEFEGRPPITLSALEFDVLTDHLGIDPLPLVLKVPSPGKTTRERATLVAQAWQSLSHRGLGRPVDVDPRTESLLRLLPRPDREVDARLWHGGPVRALTAATGDKAVLAVLRDNRLTLTEAEPTGLPRHALSVLPPHPPGPGHSVTLPAPALEAAAKAPHPEFAKALRAQGLRPADATTLAEMITEVTAHGRLGTAVRDRWGKRHRTPTVISYFDTPQGRYLQTRRPSPDGTPWATISPATPRNLLHQVTELLHQNQK